MVSVKREAQVKHLDVGARVTAKRQRKNELDEIVDGFITDISDKGVAIKWDGGKGTFDVSAIELASSQDKKDELAEDMLQHEPVKWAQCSTLENNEMLTHVVAATLYQAYVARSSAHDDLHVLFIKGEFQMFATKEMKPGALVLLPFGALETAHDTKAVGAPVVLEIGGEKSGQTTNVLYRIRPKTTPTKTGCEPREGYGLGAFLGFGYEARGQSGCGQSCLKQSCLKQRGFEPSRIATALQDDGVERACGTVVGEKEYKEQSQHRPQDDLLDEQ